MKIVTLSTLQTSIRQRCDQENSEFISDSELTAWINSSYAELYDILVSRFEDYYTSTSSFTVTTGSDSFALPSDFYKLRGVDKLIGSDYYALSKFNFNQRNTRTYRQNSQLNVNYRLMGQDVLLAPSDQANGTYKLWYIPVYTTLVNLTDTVDGINGFEEYIIVDCCIKAMEKEESSTSMFEKQKMQVLKRIEEMAANRDVDQGEQITDIYSTLDDRFLF